MKTKNRVPDTYYIDNNYAKIYKVYEDYIKFNIEQAENTKSAERQKTIFSRKLVENAGLFRINPC